MTLARKAISWLGWKATAQPKSASVPRSEEEPFTRMDRMLQIRVMAPGEPKIFTQEMNTRSILFHGPIQFQVGQTVTLRVMLQSWVQFEVAGTVSWLHEGARGASGQIEFQPTAEQAAQLREFLQLRGVKR